MDISQKIKEARTRLGLTQEALAAAAGVSARTVQNYETNSRIRGRRSVLERFEKVLGISLSEYGPESAAFLEKAAEEYGSRGRRQAEEVVKSFRVAAAGGELSDEDLDFIREAMMQTYWDAKRYNSRFGHKKAAAEDKA
ncbi:MAG: helix-turn-helix transcriptional regulator [Oscillospiraceae bacterium]|nr:helix-turn-helix transcriptional regulator [Oscillospiraceae bacterium]